MKIDRVNTSQLIKRYKIQSLQNTIEKLDKNKLHLCFYIKNFNINPLFLAQRFVYKINGDPAIDHVGFLNHFYFDESRQEWNARTIDATLKYGVVENNFIDFIEDYKGKVIIVTLPTCDYPRLREFSKIMEGLNYGRIAAALSAIDGDFVDKTTKKIYNRISEYKDKNKWLESFTYSKKSIFCSFKTALMLIDQGYDISFIEKGQPIEMTPVDVFKIAIELSDSKPQLVYYD